MTRKENNQSMWLWSIQPRLCFVYGLICLPGKVALKKHVDEYAHFTYSYQKLLVFQDTNPSNAAGWYP